MSGSSNLNSFRDRRQVAVQLVYFYTTSKKYLVTLKKVLFLILKMLFLMEQVKNHNGFISSTNTRLPVLY